MKRYKKLAVLGAVLALVCIATLLLMHYEEKQEEIKNSDAVILSVDTASVQSLAWEFVDGGFAFTKDEDGWHYDEDDTFPVSEEKIEAIISAFEEFGASFTIENAEDFGTYGLDDPDCVISMSTAERVYTIELGEYSTMDGLRYVDVGDGNVYLVSSDPADVLPSALSGVIEHDDTPIFETVDSIVLGGEETYRIIVDESGNGSYSDEDIYFVKRSGAELPLDTAAVTEYLNTVMSLELQTYVTYNATEADLAVCGMDEPELTVTVNYSYTDDSEETVSDSCTIYIGQNPNELAAYKQAEADGEEELPSVTKYVRIGDSAILYVLTDAEYEVLSGATYNDLRHKDVFWGDFSAVTQIDVTLEGETHTLVAEAEEEDERHWYLSEDEIVIADLQTALQSLSADSFTGDPPAGKEEISLLLHLDNERFPQVEIQLYRYDGSLCLAVVDGEPVSLVDRGAVMDLVEAVQAIVLNKVQSNEA